MTGDIATLSRTSRRHGDVHWLNYVVRHYLRHVMSLCAGGRRCTLWFWRVFVFALDTCQHVVPARQIRTSNCRLRIVVACYSIQTPYTPSIILCYMGGVNGVCLVLIVVWQGWCWAYYVFPQGFSRVFTLGACRPHGATWSHTPPFEVLFETCFSGTYSSGAFAPLNLLLIVAITGFASGNFATLFLPL